MWLKHYFKLFEISNEYDKERLDGCGKKASLKHSVKNMLFRMVCCFFKN